MATECDFPRSRLLKMQQAESQNLKLIERVMRSEQNKTSITAVRQVAVQSCFQRAAGKTQSSFWLLVGSLVVVLSGSGANGFGLRLIPAAWTRWLSGLEVGYNRAFGRPHYLFRTFRIISRTDPVWIACARGDQTELERLLSEGQASPYDTTEDGATLLHVSQYYANTRL